MIDEVFSEQRGTAQPRDKAPLSCLIAAPLQLRRHEHPDHVAAASLVCESGGSATAVAGCRFNRSLDWHVQISDNLPIAATFAMTAAPLPSRQSNVGEQTKNSHLQKNPYG